MVSLQKNFFFENPFTISPVYIALIWPLLKYISDLIVLSLFCQYKTTFVRNHFEVVCKLVVLLHLCLNPTNAGRYIFVVMICSYITAVLKSHLSFYPNFTFNCMLSIPTSLSIACLTMKLFGVCIHHYLMVWEYASVEKKTYTLNKCWSLSLFTKSVKRSGK